MKNFAITGVAGYIAPRHLKAIKDTGNNLVAACDPHDSVGVLDQYFPAVSFFTEFERFDRHLEKLRRTSPGQALDYLSICSPNNLHDAHIRLALRLGADAICEKPLVLNPWNLDALQELEHETGKKVYTILQLRVHPSLVALKEKFKSKHTGEKHDIILTYITSRGLWYHYSWKGDERKSGGIATNIGIHFFDLLVWIFGDVQNYAVYTRTPEQMSGVLELEQATVRWLLSIDANDLPRYARESGATTFRSITVNGGEVEFTRGFTELHTRMYETILAGNGFGIEEARPSIELVHTLRNCNISSTIDAPHPFLSKLP